MTDTGDILIGGEAINADSLGLEKTHFPTQKQKQYLIIGGIALVILILVIVIVVLAVGKSEEKTSPDNPSPSPTPTPTPTPTPSEGDDHNPNDRIGEISAIFNTKEADILSNDFSKDSSFSIYINNQYVPYTKKYEFSKTTNNEVKYYIYEEINMKNMFKGVKDLTNVEIKSSKNMKIKTLESAFNGCSDLSKLEIKGCDTSDLTSLKDFISGTKVNINDIEIPFEDLKDISYMFAGIKLTSLDLSKIKTDNVENMRGLFKGSDFCSIQVIGSKHHFVPVQIKL